VLRLLVLALLAVAVALATGPWLAAQGRTVGVVSTTMELPVLAPLTRVLTGEPRVDEVELAGSPSTLYRPARGDGPWPAVLFVNGATARGRDEPAVRRLAEGLARTGHLVAVPDLPGLRELTVTDEAVQATIGAAETISARDDVADERLGLVGVSIGGTLALLAALDEELATRIAVVTAVGPFTDLREVVRLATTGHHLLRGLLIPHETDPFVREVVEDSVAAIAPAGRRPRPVDALLRNDDPARFDELYADLPAALRDPLERLSPVRRADRLTMRVELASDPDDRYFPPEQTRLLAESAPDARLTLTRVLEHAELDLSVRELGDGFRFNRFVLRTLRELRR
jgi:dienelactone hydrolase